MGDVRPSTLVVASNPLALGVAPVVLIVGADSPASLRTGRFVAGEYDPVWVALFAEKTTYLRVTLGQVLG